MIVSASYKTDIPTFYADWFYNRMKEGFCVIKQPFSKRFKKIYLNKNTVDAFVFWTKNAKPFLPVLQRLRKCGFPFSISYTITGYPKVLENHVISSTESIETFQSISNTFGNKVNVWRYDTIIFSDITPYNYHIDRFSNIAEKLRGYTDEVIISFLQLYKKTERRLSETEKQNNIKVFDPDDEIKKSLLSKMANITHRNKMRLSVCAQNHLIVDGSKPASCVDINRLSEIAGKEITARKKGKRKDCGCFYAVDIGEYDTCPHGCVYCYAVRNQKKALSNYKKHDPLSPSLSHLPADYDYKQQLEL
jgi:hypothetical protein